MNTSQPSSPDQKIASAVLGVAWWYFLLRGLALVIAGAIFLFKPGMGTVAFTQVIGAFVLFDGLLTVISAFTSGTKARLWTIARGALATLIGWIIFTRPALIAGFTMNTLIYVVAFIVLISGIIEVVATLKGKARKKKQPSLLGGALLIAFGLLLLFAPLAFGLLIVRVIGGVAILIGLVLLFLAFQSKKLRQQID